jgi:hypothetical protein
MHVPRPYGFLLDPLFWECPDPCVLPFKELAFSQLQTRTFCALPSFQTQKNSSMYYYYYKARIQQLSRFAAKPRELELFVSGVLKDGFPSVSPPHISRCLTMQHGLPQNFNLASFWG